MSFQIDPPNPPPQFFKARQVAGATIQEKFKEFKGKYDEGLDFRWVKPELSWPSFDHLTFGYRNQVYSVLVATVRNGILSLTEKEVDRSLNACSENTLVPCLFVVHEETLLPVAGGWNLVHLQTRKPVDPLELGGDEKVEMSEWELRNFAIQVVRGHIEQMGARVDSFCDLVGIDPQIWFENKSGERSWVIVRHYPQITGNEKSSWIGFECTNSALAPFDGYHAGVSVASVAAFLYDREGQLIPLSQRFNGNAPRYRGDKFGIKFDGLDRIYVS